MDENIIDWIVWKLIELKDKSENHSHFTALTPYGGFGLPRYPSRKVDQLKDEIDGIKRTITRFNTLKTQIITEMSPIVALQQKLVALESEYTIETEKWNAELQAMRDQHPKVNLSSKTIMDELRENNGEVVICPKIKKETEK